MSTPVTVEAAPAVGRSTFITVLAWIFLIFAGFATLVSLLQVVMFLFVFPPDIWSHSRLHAETERVPPIALFLMTHVQYFFVTAWALFAATFIAAFGLLWRKNWARVYFIALMVVGIAWQIGGLWLQYAIFSSFSVPSPSTPEHFDQMFQLATRVIMLGAVVFAIVIAVLFGWIIKRLVSPPVRAEFNAL